jgi:uncharacterized protein (TIGR03437 family)
VNLPPGLSYAATNPATIQITGAPTAAAPYSYTVKVTDSTLPTAQTATQTFTGTIAPAVAIPTISSVIGAGQSVPLVTQLTTDGLFTVLGSNFAPAGVTHALSGSDLVNNALPTNMVSTCVQIGNALAPLLYVSSTQINAQATVLPSSGSVQVSVVANCGTANQLTSQPATVTVAASAPEFFHYSQPSNGQMLVVAVEASSGAYVGPPGFSIGTFVPAQVGDILTIYGNGFGATSVPVPPGDSASAADSTVGTATVTIGGIPATVLYSGWSPGTAGLYQANVVVPQGVQPGNESIVIHVNGGTSPPEAYLTIAAPPQDTSTLQSIVITPSSTNLNVGQTLQLKATATYADGSTGDITATALWTSSNVEIASVSSSGSVTAMGPGGASITAALSGISGTLAVTVAAPSALSESSANVGDTITIAGVYTPGASSTTVVFTDGAHYTLSVIPIAVTPNSVSVLVPPYLSSTTGSFAAGSVSVSVVQQPSQGSAVTTGPFTLQIADLPEIAVSPGLITLNALTQLSQASGTANQLWYSMAKMSSNVNAIGFNLQALQSNLATAQGVIQALTSGTVSQVTIGQIGGQNVYLDMSSLTVLDRLLFAYVVGSGNQSSTFAEARTFRAQDSGDDPSDALDQFVGGFSGMLTTELPQSIRNIASNNRSLISILTGLFVLANAPAEGAVAAAAVTGAVAWSATTFVSASICATLEGAGAEIADSRPPDVSDFTNTMGILYDGLKDITTGGLVDAFTDASGELGQAVNGIFQVVSGVTALIDPTAPASVASEAVNGAPLFTGNPVPYITALSPSSLPQNSAGQTLELLGVGFIQGSQGSVVTFNGVAHAVTYLSPTLLTVELSETDLATAGTYAIVATNPTPQGGASNVVQFAVGNPVPAISSLWPSSLPPGSPPQSLSINGTGFVSDSTVTLNGITHVPINGSSTQLTIELSAGDLANAGTALVVVTNSPPGGGASNTVGFIIAQTIQYSGTWSGTSIWIPPAAGAFPIAFGLTLHADHTVTGNMTYYYTDQVSGSWTGADPTSAAIRLQGSVYGGPDEVNGVLTSGGTVFSGQWKVVDNGSGSSSVANFTATGAIQ